MATVTIRLRLRVFGGELLLALDVGGTGSTYRFRSVGEPRLLHHHGYRSRLTRGRELLVLGLFTTARCSGRRCDRAPDVRRALHPHLRPGRDQCRRAHGQPICDGCARKRQRAQQPPPSRPHGSRGAPTHVRRRVLDRDQHRCQLRYSGCLGVATEVDRVRNVAAVLHAGGTRQQADDPSNLRSCVLQLSLDQNCTRAAHRLSGEQPGRAIYQVLGSRAGSVRNNFEVAGHRGAQVAGEPLWITVLAAGDERWRFGSSTVRLPQSPTVVSHHRAPCPPVVQAPHSASHNAVRSITAGHSDLIPHTHGMGGFLRFLLEVAPPPSFGPCGVRPTRRQSGYSSFRQARGSAGWAFGVRSSRKL